MVNNDTKRVLLVDDSVSSRRLLEDILTEMGSFQIIAQAENGAEAIKMYVNHRPDFVFMDIVMPLMDGLQALRVIMQLNKEACVIIASSVAGVAEKANEAIRLGARGIISKPFDPKQISQVIQSL